MNPFECGLCRSERHELMPQRDAKSGDDLPIALCTDCGLVQRRLLPAAEELHSYYAQRYRSHYKGVRVPRLKHVRRAGLAALDRLALLRRALRPGATPALLDVGAGGGEFVYLAGRAGYRASGIEPDEGYGAYAEQHYGVTVRQGTVADLGDERVDVITLFHVLEHLREPDAVLQRLHGLLNDGGLLFVEVPNLLQPDASPHNVYFGAHLYYYTRATLFAVASPYFEPVRWDDAGNLKVIFRRRAAIAERHWLDHEDVAALRDALSRKGWWQYLSAGGGWRKPFSRLARAWTETRLPLMTARELLDGLYDAAQPRIYTTAACCGEDRARARSLAPAVSRSPARRC